jgi:hypothetical protein
VNRRANVYRVGSSMPRSRVCLSPMDGEARACREVGPLRRAFLGDVGVAKALTSLENNPSPTLLRPGGTPL